MSRTERMKLDWEHCFETGKFRMVESSDRAECGCKHCTVNKRFYKRQDAKKARREAKALVCFEATNPENGHSFGLSEPRVVLQDRRGYSTLDWYYFWEHMHVYGKLGIYDWGEPAPHTSQSEGY